MNYKARFFTLNQHIFTTLRAINGQALYFSQHLARLQAGVESYFGQKIDIASCLSGPPVEDGIWRIAVIDTAEGRSLQQYPAQLEVKEQFWPGSWSECSPREVGLSPHQVVENGLPAGIKFSQYFAQAYELRKSVFDDLLYFDSRGHLIEASTSNVFVKIQGRWLTPPLTGVTFPGVVRQALLDLGPFEIFEADIARDDMDKVEEMFLTNSAWFIMPVKTLNHRHLNSSEWGPLQELLIKRGGQAI